MDKRCVGLAIFGAGRMGNVHFRNILLNPDAEVRWILETDVKRAEELVRCFKMENNIKVCPADEVEMIYQDPSVDAVLIVTPVSTHEKLIKGALAAHKAVFCEKPLAPSIQGIKECYDLAGQVKKPLFCGFHRRFEPQVRHLFKKIRSGDLGVIRTIKTSSRDPPGINTAEYIAASGGIYLDSSVHDIDVVGWLIGENPVSVYATGFASDPLYRDNDDIDTSIMIIRYESGALGVINNARNAMIGYDQRIEVHGTKEDVFLENKRPEYLSTSSMTSEGHTVDTIEPIYQGIDRYASAYKNEIDQFINIVRDGEACEVEGRDVINGCIIAHACKESLRSGEVVTLKGRMH